MSEEIKLTTFAFGGLDRNGAVNLQEFLTQITDYFNAEYHEPWKVRKAQDGTFVVIARIFKDKV